MISVDLARTSKKGNILNTQPFTTDFLNQARRNDLYADAAAVRTSHISVGSQPENKLLVVARAAMRMLAALRPATSKAPVAAGG